MTVGNALWAVLVVVPITALIFGVAYVLVSLASGDWSGWWIVIAPTLVMGVGSVLHNWEDA